MAKAVLLLLIFLGCEKSDPKAVKREAADWCEQMMPYEPHTISCSGAICTIVPLKRQPFAIYCHVGKGCSLKSR